jgi:hypothetical protein
MSSKFPNLTSVAFLFCLSFFVLSCAKKPIQVVSVEPPKDWKVEDGFSPATFHGTFDSLKEQKIRELVGEGYTKVRKVKMDESLLMTWRVKAAIELTERSSKDNNKTYKSITNGVWVVDAAHLDEFASYNVIEGKWIQFKEDLTYEYGKFDKTIGKGRYHYQPLSQLVLLLDQKENVRPLEYEIGWSDGYIVLQGTPTFDDTEIAIKMINANSKPKP